MTPEEKAKSIVKKIILEAESGDELERCLLIMGALCLETVMQAHGVPRNEAHRAMEQILTISASAVRSAHA